MKSYLFALFFLFCSVILCAQYTNETSNPSPEITNHSYRDFIVSASPDLLFNTLNGLQFAGGLKIKMFIGKRLSFDSDLVISRDYLHGGFGLIGIPLWLIISGTNLYNAEESRSLSELLAMGVFLLLSTEHAAINIPVRRDLDLSPYISLLRLKESYKHGDYSNPYVANQQACFAAGLELNKYFRRIVLAPYVEYEVGYTDRISGFNMGIYCGIYFPSKTK